MSWGRKGKRTTLVVPNNQREISMLSSHSDSVDDWNKGDTTHNHGETQGKSYAFKVRMSEVDSTKILKIFFPLADKIYISYYLYASVIICIYR